MATLAVDTVIGFLKLKLPPELSGQLESLLSGQESSSGIMDAVKGLFGKKERADRFSDIAASAMELDHQTLEQSALTAAIWGVPIASVNAMRQAFLRDASRIVALGEEFRIPWRDQRDHRRSHHSASRGKLSIP